MSPNDRNPLSERAIWIRIAIVFVCVLGVLIAIYIHEQTKPDSPHVLVAAAFNQMIIAQEWQPGMGPKPLVYHPATANSPAWKPLPPRRQFVGR
jgi:hypothetical protein